MTETAATFPDPNMTNITDLGTEFPKIDGDMNCLEKISFMKPSVKS